MHDIISTGSMLERRKFLALAGFGTAASLLPKMSWANAAQLYPSVKSGIDGLVSSGKYPNAYVAIGKGLLAPEILSKGTLALNDQRPLDMDTLWRVYSMTKPITGMAAMILVGQGKIALDQPIADFLPEFASMRVLTDPDKSLVSVPAKTQITLRNLLTHTAGLGYAVITKGPLLKEYLKNGITPGPVSRLTIPGFDPGAATPDIKTFSKRLAALPLIAEPGTKWSYSISLDLLGHLIGVVSGMEFGAFIQKHIFNPLKMNSSYFQVPVSETSRLVTNYGAFGPLMLPIDPGKNSVFTDKPSFPSGGGGLVTSTRDYDRFLKMLLNNGSLDGANVLSPDMVALGVSNLLPEGVTYEGGNAGFGAGGRVGIGRNEGSYGWGGAAGTIAAVHLKYKLRMIGMTQVMGLDNMDLQKGLAEWVLKDVLSK